MSEASTANLELSALRLAFDADGDPVVTWYRSDGVVGRRIQTTTDDTHGPRLRDVEIPERADPGETDTLGNRSEQTRTVTVGDPSRREDPRRDDPPVVVPPVDPPIVDPPIVVPPVLTPPAVDPPRPAPPAAPRPRARARARAFAGCRVPKLAGLTLPQVRRRLSDANCRLGRVRTVATTRRGPARILRTSRRAGARLRRGARVDVTLAKRPTRPTRRS